MKSRGYQMFEEDYKRLLEISILEKQLVAIQYELLEGSRREEKVRALRKRDGLEVEDMTPLYSLYSQDLFLYKQEFYNTNHSAELLALHYHKMPVHQLFSIKDHPNWKEPATMILDAIKDAQNG